MIACPVYPLISLICTLPPVCAERPNDDRRLERVLNKPLVCNLSNHWLSCTSLLRPGRFLVCRALTSQRRLLDILEERGFEAYLPSSRHSYATSLPNDIRPR
jgi:hypothetical protein